MKIENIVNYHYINSNTIQFLDINGNIFNKTIKELGYPYFYGIPDSNKRFSDEEMSYILKAEKMELPILTQTGIINKEAYKITVDLPKHISILREKFSETYEAKIPYIRRLAFDGVIEWAKDVPRYADIDIEERNGNVELIGYYDNVTNKYEAYYSVDDFVATLKERKILEIYAWNGQSYDFERLDGLIHDNYYTNILKLDAMFMYSIYQQKPPRTLNLAGKENGVGTKVPVVKPFSQLTRHELEIYNQQDVNIQTQLMEQLGIRKLLHYYSNYLALHPNEIYTNESKFSFTLRPSASRAFDSLVIRTHKPRVYLLDATGVGVKSAYEGGFVLEPEKGIYRDVASFDYNSLYPHVIMYKDNANFIYQLIKNIERDTYDKRVHFKAKYKETGDGMYNTGQAVLKILINSLYGVFANPYFRYFNEDVAQFITSEARKQIQKLITLARSMGYKIVYADTDSCFVYDIPKKEAEQLVSKLNNGLKPFELKLEKWFPKVLFFGD